jgi:hypothetical protein
MGDASDSQNDIIGFTKIAIIARYHGFMAENSVDVACFPIFVGTDGCMPCEAMNAATSARR